MTTANRTDRRDARTRILETAYELFSHHGIRNVGIDTIIAASGVAKMSLYRHFHSKDELALAFLELRERRWTRGWLEAEITRRASEPRARLIAAFDVLDEWFHGKDFEGCAFISALLEFGDLDHPVRDASVLHLETVRAILRGLAEEAGFREPERLARELQLLMQGAIVSASMEDLEAAQRAKRLASLALAREDAAVG